MDEIEAFLIFCTLGFSSLLFGVSLISVKKLKDLKLVLIAIAFLLFLIEAIIMAVGVFFPQYEDVLGTKGNLTFNLVILAFLYASIVKR